MPLATVTSNSVGRTETSAMPSPPDCGTQRRHRCPVPRRRAPAHNRVVRRCPSYNDGNKPSAFAAIAPQIAADIPGRYEVERLLSNRDAGIVSSTHSRNVPEGFTMLPAYTVGLLEACGGLRSTVALHGSMQLGFDG